MKKISPRMGEVAKEVARTLTKVVGKGLAVGGGLAALGFGMAGCESTPTVATQTLEGPVVNYYDDKAPNGKPATYFIVDTDGNLETTADQKYLFLLDQRVLQYPEVRQEGTIVRFTWDAYNQSREYGGFENIKVIAGKVVQH
jgi:hypothetical protein